MLSNVGLSSVAHFPLLIDFSEYGGRENGDVATGHGPERAVLQRAIQILITEETLWTRPDSAGHVRPVFTPSVSQEHMIRWRTTGTFILLHLLTLGNGPEPISPFLMYLLLAAASSERKHPTAADALISLQSLYELDSGASETLRPWMLLKASDDISRCGTGQIPRQVATIQHLLATFDLQVCAVTMPSNLLR